MVLGKIKIKSPTNPENPLHKWRKEKLLLIIIELIKPDCETHYRQSTNKIAGTKRDPTFYIVEQM